MLDKAIDTKVDTGVEIVKCISLLHSIIVDFEDYCRLHCQWSQHDSLSLPPTRATRMQGTNKLGRCYQRPFRTLTRYTLRRSTAPFTYMCLYAKVSGRKTRVHAGRWHAGHSQGSSHHQTTTQEKRIESPHNIWIEIYVMMMYRIRLKLACIVRLIIAYTYICDLIQQSWCPVLTVW